MQSFEILITLLTPLIVAVFATFQKIAVAKINKNSEKMQRDVKEIKKKLYKNEQERDYIADLHKIKQFYLNKFRFKAYRDFACFKADKFISVVSCIIQTTKVNTESYNAIVSALDSGKSTVKKEMKERFGIELTDLFWVEHQKDYSNFLKKVEDIVSDIENHHKEKFLKASNIFLKKFMKQLIKHEIGV